MNREINLVKEERVSSLFQPDTLLPEQYFETLRRRVPVEPEKRLILAVLEDAVACFQRYAFATDGKGRTKFREAEEWIVEGNSAWFFSFENICEILEFDPQYVRQGLLQWKKARLVGRRKADIYALAPRMQRTDGWLEPPRKTGQRLLKAAGR